MSYISCTNLAIGYEGTAIIENLSFKVDKGDYLCVLGENGAGKSTLVKTLLRLIRPISGSITMGDGLKPYEIGYLPQQTVVQRDFPATAWEIVMSGNLSSRRNHFFYSKADKQTALLMMDRLNITGLKKASYKNLSGGQQQRVLLARALVAGKRILLLDEPVTGLDPMAAADFYEITASLNQEGISVIMVSHDLQAVGYASHILHIDKDTSFFGTKKEYTESEKGRHFLGESGEERKYVG